MRDDVLITEVLAKCEVLRQANFWPTEQVLQPKAWLRNFEECDLKIAAILLDRFTYYSKRLTDTIFVAAYNSLGDGLSKGPTSKTVEELLQALEGAVFTPVTGENPNPTDSGYVFCRLARQILGVPEDLIVTVEQAVAHALSGGTVVFLDDFIGTGEQFLTTWKRKYTISATVTSSFFDAGSFPAIYLSLISTDYGLRNIHAHAPSVDVCVAHILGDKSTIFGLENSVATQKDINDFLRKYSVKLRPNEDYISVNPDYLMYGFKKRGLLMGFEHSIPDATLPIFWAKGIDGWQPLIERS